MKQISDLIGKHMAVIVLVVAALALFVPGSCTWVQTSWINTLLMIVMFGMGLTLKTEDFMSDFQISQWRLCPERSFRYGTTYPERSSRIY